MPSTMKIAIRTKEVHRFRIRAASLATLFLAAMAAAIPATAQQQAPQGVHFAAPVVALTYDLERAKTSGSCGCFWLQGGGADIGVPIYRGLGVAFNVSGGYASNIQPGVNLGKISYVAGPRYTLGGPHRGTTGSHLQLFGHALFGGAHAFDGLFPVAGGTTSTASSFAMQLGGGVDATLHSGLGLRLLEGDYVRTSLPNNGSNSQNDLRLAFGVTYRFAAK